MPKQGNRRNSRTAKREFHDAKVGKEKETFKELKEARIQEAAGGYKWEQHGGGLSHHCFQCATPLTNPCARSKCFGKHMVVCERFHNTMFKVGAENTCDSCHNYMEALHVRQRDIAVLVNHVRSFDKAGEPDEPEQNANTPDLPAESSSSASPSITPARKPTRKEKKQAKATVRAANLAKKTLNKVTAAEIEHVAKVMREEPRAARLPSLQVDGADDEDDPEDDVATSASKTSTHPPVKGRRHSLSSVQTEEGKREHAMMILKSLGVKTDVKGASRARKNAIRKLVEGIRGYYVWLGAERADVEMRGEGFLKFAGNQAFRTIMDILEENRVWRAQGERAASGDVEVRGDADAGEVEWEGRGVWENWGWIEGEGARGEGGRGAERVGRRMGKFWSS